MYKLTTPYAEKLNKECPLPEYPRPLFKRDSYVCLNGEWDFEISSSELVPTEYSQKILVPFPPESALSGVERAIEKTDRLYYRRTFTLPEGFKRDRVILHLGAVDQCCEVYVNGDLQGEHKGGYIPFSFDITDSLTDGENELTIKAVDELDLKYPYGKQKKNRGGMWYTPVSGIWQTVWLESIPEKHIRKIKITPEDTRVTIEVDANDDKKRLTLLDSGETFEFDGRTLTFTPARVEKWSPENPYLYYFSLECGEDRIESYFALRKIEIGDAGGMKRLMLNGKPYLFNGLLDQGYFPDGIFLPADYSGYEEDIRIAKSLGFNMLRKHIKIEPQIFYYLCDKMGMVVFQDMINNSDYSFFRDTALPTVGLKSFPDKRMHKNKESRRIFRETMLEMQTILYNHPSILYYTIFNEGWGQFSADEMYELAKGFDGTRIYDSTSGWFWQKKSDVDSHHVYFKSLFKIKKKPSMPTVISEFGGYAYRCDGHLFSDKNYGYTTYKSQEEFSSAVEELYLNEVIPMVKSGVCALVYTQVSDVEDETNGFMTYDRQLLKVNEKRFSEVTKKLFSAFEESNK